ncbi:MAG: helix-turn-helix transcriptional regulator [Spongiibacteraceae bacterium]|jgi:transcriptional regulator with XRE-family HTH domain|nr:helix-turn-helix transcriptional regulator [Spongiibacteraceae bacterium]
MSKDPLLIALGAKIRAVRQAKGFSQEAFAAEAGLGRSYYGGIERGERNVAALNLVQIAKILGVEVGELFPTLKELRKIAKED